MLDSILHPAAPHPAGPGITGFVLLIILLVVVLARVLGNLANRFGQPRVVGEIVAGILLGPTLLGRDLSGFIAPAGARPTLSFVATLALILFMFLVGLEVDASLMRGREGQATTLGLLSVAVPAIAAVPVAILMHHPRYAGPAGASVLAFSLFIGACLSVTALPVIAHVLRERGELNSSIGGLGVATSAVASVGMFTYIALTSAVIHASGYGAFLVKVGLVAGTAVVARYLVRRPLRWWLKRNWIPGNGLSADGTATVFAGLFLAALIADRLGVNAMVGAFAWGMVMPADLQLRQALSYRLSDVATVVLLPVFFAYSGLLTDLRLLSVRVLPILGLVLAVSIASKFVAAVPARAYGASWRETAVLGALMNTRGLVLLVVGLIGLDLHVITQASFTMFVVVALATNIMVGPLLDRLSSRSEPEEMRQLVGERL